MAELFSEATVNQLQDELQKETKLRQSTEDALRREVKENERLRKLMNLAGNVPVTARK